MIAEVLRLDLLRAAHRNPQKRDSTDTNLILAVIIQSHEQDREGDGY